MTARFIGALAVLCLCGTSANALSMKECSVKYKAAQTAGTLNGQKWADFRKAECGTDAAATPTATPAPSEKTAVRPAPSARPAVVPAAPTAAGNAIFPNAVDAKYSKESAGKARMHTCVDQYNLNKASNANGGMKWTEKGGGYYSECNKRLKG